ncbi:TIGR03862 family flavoprotein [Roseomonas sp. PWR1]|uniref:TIGR03862 family flavoprotein n=1 Tax=Roseomonas nitratireducens TaxID=2820810 RepID=A0ABS4ANW4_9PROT|nr:TIGR03862 family flavoprotein [Neoroseomonas nitratireducens]MBP0463053.1 TIGR03862 family flavoprotein [Neoroseomonas nitratireducens]
MTSILVIGAGPAGLMAAEAAAGAGASVTVHDHMPSPARKLLIAGRGGLNLTHSEPLEAFLDHYGPARARLEPFIRAFPPDALVAWCEALGQPTFVGSSGRVFPRAMKASPLLRAWLARLASLGVALKTRHRWIGFAPDGAPRFATPEGEAILRADAVVLALGGASWPRLGSDGAWTALLPGCAVAPLRPANMGFAIAWSDHLRARFAGTPLKRIALAFEGRTVRGEAVLTEQGIEGGAVYALSAPLREAIARDGAALLRLDLRPDVALADLSRRLAARARGVSLSNHLRRAAGLPPVAVALVQEALHAGASPADPAALVKALPLRLTAPFPIARAISSAGGLAWAEVDETLMLRSHPGVFACGEMLDWEAPTGGYLLQACFATGRAAGINAKTYSDKSSRS